MFYLDSFRNIFLSFDLRVLATIFQATALIASIVVGFILGHVLQWSIWGIYLSSNLILALSLMFYISYMRYGSGFGHYRKGIHEETAENDSKNWILLQEFDQQREITAIVENSKNKFNERKEENLGELKSYKGYFIYCLNYGLQGLSEAIAFGVCLFVPSMLFDTHEYSSLQALISTET